MIRPREWGFPEGKDGAGLSVMMWMGMVGLLFVRRRGSNSSLKGRNAILVVRIGLG